MQVLAVFFAASCLAGWLALYSCIEFCYIQFFKTGINLVLVRFVDLVLLIYDAVAGVRALNIQ